MIHDTAIVSPKAKVSSEAIIGPYCIVEDDVEIGAGVILKAHVCVSGNTYIGEGCEIFPFTSLGYKPQDLKYHGEKATLIIGKNNTIREHVTMHIGTSHGRMETRVGDSNLFMVGVHIAHDCVIGSRNVLGNNVTLGGHVVVEDDVIIGGLAAVHQFTRIGHHSIIGGLSGIERDVIPYGAVKGERAHLYGLNLIGMKRAEIEKCEILALLDAYKTIFSEDGNLEKNVERVAAEFSENFCVREVVAFLKAETNRSFCLPQRK